jgi:hypothetical protein
LIVERKDNIIYFNNDDGIAYGYVLRTPEGYRMAFYAGIVISPEDLRIVNKEVTNFINPTLLRTPIVIHKTLAYFEPNRNTLAYFRSNRKGVFSVTPQVAPPTSCHAGWFFTTHAGLFENYKLQI